MDNLMLLQPAENTQIYIIQIKPGEVNRINNNNIHKDASATIKQ